ncbi:MAG: class I SAM-dependent methyltransferase [Nocardioides sp.]|nr:class I SAM-dependent methyltransferase [Nocardioides sp.]
MSQPCRVCRTETIAFDSGQVLGHVEVTYQRCPECGLVMAVDPSWLDEAYGSAIAKLDIGLLDRCQILANVTATVLRSERLRGGRFMDWAGGYGTLTRLMRDRGYDFTHTDPLATNVFAEGHQLEQVRGERFDLITAFEVLEHLEDPIASLADVAAATDRLLVTTLVLPEPAPRPGEWWYYTPESGQHITFYTRRSLEALALELGFDGVVTSDLVHYFHRGKAPALTRAAVRRPPIAYGVGHLAAVLDRRHSLLQSDLTRITG